MEQPILRIGAVGTSVISHTMQEAISLTPGVVCTAVCSRDEARGKAFAATHGIPIWLADFDALLARDDVDAVYIATPNPLHVPQTIAALAHGKHVIVEKPAAVTEAGVQAMCAAAEANGVFFFEAITTLFMPNYLVLKELLPKLGRLARAEICYGQVSSRIDDYRAGRNPSAFDPAMQGGALNDMGVYCVHMAVDLFGAPERADYSAVLEPNGIDISGTLTLQYPACTVTVRTAKDANIGSGCRFTGAQGEFVEDGPLNAFAACSAKLNGAPYEGAWQPDGNRMVYELARFRDAIWRRDKPFYEAMALQSRRVASVLERAHGG